MIDRYDIEIKLKLIWKKDQSKYVLEKELWGNTNIVENNKEMFGKI